MQTEQERALEAETLELTDDGPAEPKVLESAVEPELDPEDTDRKANKIVALVQELCVLCVDPDNQVSALIAADRLALAAELLTDNSSVFVQVAADLVRSGAQFLETLVALEEETDGPEEPDPDDHLEECED